MIPTIMTKTPTAMRALSLLILANILSCSNPQENRDKYLQGQRFEERKYEQETLRKGLAELKYFNGDGQLRFQSGGYHGSAFWFNKSVIMTNDHVVEGKPLSDLEYITFPTVVFYRAALKDRIETYVKTRLERAHKDIQGAIPILERRISNLMALAERDERLTAILTSYQEDLKLLQSHKRRELSDITFIPIETAIDTIFRSGNTWPDVALIVLKKPIDVLSHDLGLSLKTEHDWFAENNLYHPDQQGFLYAGTPVYITGYGREINGSSTDKNKSLTAMRVGFNQINDSLHYKDIIALAPAWVLEKEFYYFQSSNFGDSGSRIWAFLNENGTISQKPRPLNQKKVTIGIHNSNGGGILFSKSSLAAFTNYLNVASLPQDFNVIIPEPMHYLLNFKASVPTKFTAALSWYVLYKKLLAEKHYQEEEAYLWFIIDGPLPDTPELLQKSASFDQNLRNAIVQFFSASEASPSELTEDEWANIIITSPLVTDEQKLLFKKMRQGSLFDDLGENFYVDLKNLGAPVRLDTYIKALNAWVNNNKYRRSKNYDHSITIKLLDPNRIFSNIDEILSL
jgi:hypothetical protein